MNKSELARLAGSDLAFAQLMKESEGKVNAVSPKRAYGLMQLMPDTQKDPGYNVMPLRNNSPEENIRFGNDYRNAMIKEFGGDKVLGLMAYNWGPDRVQRWRAAGSNPNAVPEETRNYVATILANEQKLQGNTAVGGAGDDNISDEELMAFAKQEGIPLDNEPSDEELLKFAKEEGISVGGQTKSSLADYASNAVAPIGDYFGEVGRQASDSMRMITDGFNNGGDFVSDKIIPKNVQGMAQSALGALGLVSSPINAAITSFIGRPVENATKEAQIALGVDPSKATGIPAKYTDFAASLFLPTMAGNALAKAATPAGFRTAAEIKKATIAPNADEVRAASSQTYQSAAEKGGVIRPESNDAFIGKIMKNEQVSPETEAIFGKSPAKNIVEKFVEQFKNKPMTLQHAQEFDQSLGDLANSNVLPSGKLDATGQKYYQMQQQFRDHIAGLSEADVVGGKEGFDALKTAREQWAASVKMSDLERIVKNADLADNPSTAIRSGLKTLLKNPKRMRGFTKEETAAIREAAKTGVVTELMRFFGSRLTGIVAAGSGHPVAGVAANMMSGLGREVAGAAQAAKVQEAINMVAGRSGVAGKVTPETAKQMAKLPAITNAIKAVPLAQAVKPESKKEKKK